MEAATRAEEGLDMDEVATIEVATVAARNATSVADMVISLASALAPERRHGQSHDMTYFHRCLIIINLAILAVAWATMLVTAFRVLSVTTAMAQYVYRNPYSIP